MKYDNFTQAKELVEKIDKIKSVLEDIDSTKSLAFINKNNYPEFSLSRDVNLHDNLELARITKQFYADVKNTLVAEIFELEKELEKL